MPALRLDKMTSKGSFQPEPFCVPVKLDDTSRTPSAIAVSVSQDWSRANGK